MSSSYRHTQSGGVQLTIFAVAFVVFAFFGFRAGWPPALLFALAILFVLGILFYSLTVEISGGVLECRFGPGLIRKRFALRDVLDARPVRNRWYYGWGIRWIPPRGWMFNISGFDAVELSLASGKYFRIGTDQPEELAAAIRKAKG